MLINKIKEVTNGNLKWIMTMLGILITATILSFVSDAKESIKMSVVNREKLATICKTTENYEKELEKIKTNNKIEFEKIKIRNAYRDQNWIELHAFLKYYIPGMAEKLGVKPPPDSFFEDHGS